LDDDAKDEIIEILASERIRLNYTISTINENSLFKQACQDLSATYLSTKKEGVVKLIELLG